MDVLVAYATKSGATRGVAERITDRLNGHRFAAVAAQLPGAGDPDDYGAVLLGSAVYAGAWLSPAEEFARRHAAILTGRPVWTFTVGLLTGQRRLLARVRWLDAKNIDDLDLLVGARGHRFFAGAIGPAGMSVPQRLVFRAAGGRFGDFRDWPDVDAWADEIAAALTSPSPYPAVRPTG